MRPGLLLIIITVGIALVLITNTFFVVNEMQQAIVLQFGAPKKIYNARVDSNGPAGLHVKIPFLQQVIYFDKRIQNADMESLEVPDSERRRLKIDAFVRYRIVRPLYFYQTLVSEESGRSRMLTLLSSSLRDAMGTTTIFTVLSEERGTVMTAIKNAVNQSAQPFGIEVIDVRIRRADLPDQNISSILDRMVAERAREANEARAEGNQIKNTIESQAEREKIVILAEANKQAQIIRGQGDAERNRVYAEAYSKDAGFFDFYRSMLAYQTALSDNDTTLVISPNSEFFKFFGDDRAR